MSHPLPPLHGTLIFVAVLSILYGLVCGCGMTMTGLPLAHIGKDPAESQRVFEQAGQEFLKGYRSLAEEPGRAPEQREQLQALARHLEEREFPAVFGKSAAAALHSDAGRRMGQLSLGALASQLGFLVLGIVLFARVRWSRGFGFLVCVAAAATTILLLVDARDVAARVEQDVRGLFPESSPVPLGSGGPVGGLLGEGFSVAFVLLSLLLVLWPVIAFLCLLFSRGIRRTLGLEVPEADVFPSG
jgi:hypothetical protein